MKKPRVLIKVGGAALVEEQALNLVLEAIKQYRNDGYRVVIVHGGGPAINAELTKKAIKWKFLNGQRITTPEMMEVIETTLCGQVNGKLVRHFNAHGVPSVGLSGTDNRTLLCTPLSEELGMVGNVQQVNSLWIEDMLKASSPMPVIAPVGVGLDGQAYNINADWAATKLAAALEVDQLIFITDQDGVLNAEGSAYSSLCLNEIDALVADGIVTGGMLTKMNAVTYALRSGIACVRVIKGSDAVFACNNSTIGTWCTNESALKAAVNAGAGYVTV